jgi:hypothetical protein
MGVFFATSFLTHLKPQQFFGIAFWIGFSASAQEKKMQYLDPVTTSLPGNNARNITTIDQFFALPERTQDLVLAVPKARFVDEIQRHSR